MSTATPTEVPDIYEQTYYDIVEFYDIAEALVDTVEDPRAQFHDEQMTLIENLAEEVVECSDELTEKYCQFVDARDRKRAARKFKFRNTFKRMFRAINGTCVDISDMPADMAENITALIMPAIERLLKQTEHVFSMLVTLVEKVRDASMKRREFRDMVMREAHMATMVHQQMLAAESSSSFK